MDEEKLAQLQRTLSGVSEQYRQHMDALAKSLTTMFQPVNQLAATAAAISPPVQPLLDTLAKIDWPKLRARMEWSCERLANLGWTLPMRFAPGQLVELAEQGNTDQQVEQYMLDYFTFESGRFFLDLRGDVLGSANLVGWRALLEQCFDAYDRGHYLVPTPALLSVIEGAVAQNAGKLKATQVNTKKLAADLEKAAQPDSMDSLVWRSARVVLDKVFASSDFGGPHPGELNRHWALHGRDQTQWTQTDALRLFNLLATIS
jgi:hypothetical protein